MIELTSNAEDLKPFYVGSIYKGARSGVHFKVVDVVAIEVEDSKKLGVLFKMCDAVTHQPFSLITHAMELSLFTDGRYVRVK